MKKYYLAYGSNLNLKQMKIRCRNAVPVGKTILNDYTLVYKGSSDGKSWLTIEKCKDSSVPIGIFQISFLDELALDKYEGYPEFYHKEYFPVVVDDKTHNALIYIMNSNFEYYLPSFEYVETCTEGYNDFGFDLAVLNQALKTTKNNIKNKSS